MALIVIHHTIADNFDVDPQYSVATNGRILQGMLVGLNANGFVNRAGNNASAPASVSASDDTDGTSANNYVLPLGIAGDSLSDEYRESAYAADLVIGHGRQVNGAYVAPMRWTSNRVSDFYNETLASGKMTVYIGSGRFATDQYDASQTYYVGQPLYPADSTNLPGVSNSTSDFFTNQSNSSNARRVGYVAAVPTAYPSGVPGVDSPSVETSMSLGTFLTVILSI
jgi:hypothetical protein